MVSHDVENHIVMLPTGGEVLLRVVNDPICADGSHHFNVPRTAYSRDFRAQPLGYLHGERAHATRGTIDQDLLPRLNLSLVAKSLQGGECRYRDRSRLLKRYVLRLAGQCCLGSTSILGKGAWARAEHLVTRFEPRYVPADRFDLAGHVAAGSGDLSFTQRGQYATQERMSQ